MQSATKKKYLVFGIILVIIICTPLATMAFTKILSVNSVDQDSFLNISAKKDKGQGEGSSIPETLVCDGDKILICHKPNTPASQEQCVEPSALQQHLDHGDGQGACETQTEPTADLFVDITVDNNYPSEGEEITFIITVLNQGPDTATNIAVSEQLPAGISYVNSVSTTGSYDSNSGIWEIPSLNNGTSAILQIVAIIDSGSSGQTLINEVKITELDQVDSDLSNNIYLVDIFVNSNPISENDYYIVDEDEELSVPAHGVLENDMDGDYDELSAILTNPPQHGELELNEDGSFTYVPDENYFGEDSFNYHSCDTNNVCSNGTVFITVNSVNDAPEANSDEATTIENREIIIEVLADDIDEDNDKLTIVSVTTPQNGTVQINDDNTVTYTVTYIPNENFNGTDSFSYTVEDGHGGTDTAEVFVLINAVNQPPVAVDDIVSLNEDSSLVINVLNNDHDPDLGSLIVGEIHSQPVHGTATLNSDDTITYIPNDDYNGVDHFGYSVCDQDLAPLCNEAEVVITVNSVNDAPIIADDIASTSENQSITIEVLSDDVDEDDDILTIQSVSDPQNGSTTVNSDNTITYTPDQNFSGSDSFTYTATDGNGGTGTATVEITVSNTDSPPIPVDDTASVNEDSSVVVDVLQNDSDADGDALEIYEVHTQPVHGTVEIINNELIYTPGDVLVYTPDANYNGQDHFGYTVCDINVAHLCNEAEVVVLIISVNDAPVAGDDIAGVNENGSIIIEVLADDFDADDDILTITSVSNPQNGTAIINSDNTITYTPDENYSGTDTFSYTVSDGNGGEDTGLVTVTVAFIDIPPEPVDDNVSVNEDESIIINVLENDGDVDSTLIVSELHAQPAHGVVVLNDDYTITYTPDENYNGPDNFGYLACEADHPDHCNEAEVFIDVISVNDLPVAVEDAYITMEGQPVMIDPLENDHDIEGGILRIFQITDPDNGTVQLYDDNTMIYTPNENFVGEDSFTYTVIDGEGGGGTIDVGIIVNAVPEIENDLVVLQADNEVDIDVLGNDSDTDGDDLILDSVSVSTAGARVWIDHHGTPLDLTDDTLHYVVPDGFEGEDSLIYTVSDGHGNHESGTLTLRSEIGEAEVIAEENEKIRTSVCFHCDLLEYEIYIINPDGTERIINTDYVQSMQIGENVWLYKFEDKGVDFDYNDVEILIDSRICAEPILTVISNDSIWDHQIKVRLIYKNIVKKDILLWESSKESVGQEKIIDLYEHQDDLCYEKNCNISCEDIDFTCYIVNPDGTKRFSGTKFAQKEKLGDNFYRYMFEDRGNDFDYNDAGIEVDLTDCRNSTISILQHPAVDHRLHHEIWVQAENENGKKVDLNIWRSSHAHEGVAKTKRLNLADHEELCSD